MGARWSFLVLLVLPSAAEPGPALVIDRVQVNVRADATVQSERIGVLRQGEVVEQLAEKDEWYRIRLPDGREGWLHADLVQQLLVVVRRGGRVRGAPSTSAPTVGQVNQGDELAKTGQQGNWYQVVLPQGGEAWIWKELVEPKLITLEAAPLQNPVAQTEEAELPLEDEPPEEAAGEEGAESAEGEEAESPEAGYRHPYAEGLQQLAAAEYRAALHSFEEVLRQDPNHVNALLHAARAHKQLEEYDQALDRLYQALELGQGRRDIFMTLAEVHRLSGQPDSAHKYQALFRGEEWAPPTPVEPADQHSSGAEEPFPMEMLWIYGAVAGGAFLVLGIALLSWRLSRKPRDRELAADKPARGKFGRTLQESREQPLRPGSGEVEMLDLQIREKRQQLQESAQAFLGTKAVALAGEEGHLEHLLGHLEALRKALEMQDERARLYADIVRLQNMKIEAMSRELHLLHRRGRG
jgi:SH3-like domain-containing protein